MLNLTSMTWVFLQLPGGDAEEDNKYSVFAVKGFCLLWAPSKKGRHCWVFVFCWPGRTGSSRIWILRSLIHPVYSYIPSTTGEQALSVLQSKQNSHFTAPIQVFKGSFLFLACPEPAMDGQIVKLWLSLCVLSLLSGFVPITGYTCLPLYRVTVGWWWRWAIWIEKGHQAGPESWHSKLPLFAGNK